MRKTILCMILGTLLLAAGARPMNAAEPPPAEKLHDLFHAEWEWTMRENPTWASRLGDLRYNDRWPDVSPEAIRQRHRHRQQVLRQLDDFDPDDLSPPDRINLRLFRRRYQTEVDAYRYRWYLVPLDQRDGIQDANSLADSLPFTTVKHYEDWIARLRSFPRYMAQTTALMQRGIEEGIVHSRIVMQRVPSQIARQIVDDPEQSLFYKPLRSFPEKIGEQQRQRLRREATRAIAENVVPAFRQFQTFFNEKYLPACYEKPGVWQIPDGKPFYAHRARKYTTTELTPKEIHAIGKREVERIRGEMERIVEQVEWDGTFQQFLTHLRTDPKFYYDDANQLLEAYKRIGKKVDPQLPRLFGRLPRIRYTVESIPMHIAPDTTTAYYRPPSADGRRPGTYFVNLYKPQARPKYEMEVLSLHEAVPGHHLQIALAMEMQNLPAFRRYTGYTAFVEGWALYSERLGEDLGLYRDPYSKFGQLTYEMWRAIRLVVDTGIHYFGWSRQDAIDLFTQNTAKTRLDIENEVDRYIAWPGQALAYKIGELKITALRRRAEKQLGEKFDLRAFHDVVLGSGAVTLDVLESNVEAWIRETDAR